MRKNHEIVSDKLNWLPTLMLQLDGGWRSRGAALKSQKHDDHPIIVSTLVKNTCYVNYLIHMVQKAQIVLEP